MLTWLWDLGSGLGVGAGAGAGADAMRVETGLEIDGLVVKLFGTEVWRRRVVFEQADALEIHCVSSWDGFQYKGNNNPISIFLIAVSRLLIIQLVLLILPLPF